MASKKINNKSVEINKKLAAYFLSLEKGESIKSIRNLSRNFQASLGLISQTISKIEKNGAVIIDRHGQLGSFIKEISIGKLWQIAIGEPLVIAHTLPSNRRYEGLAAAIKRAFHRVGIETYFIFIRGSRTRIKALRDHRCQIAITSLFAANGLCQSTESIALSLPQGSFISSHKLFTRTNLPSTSYPLIAAVDPDSYDQMHLSEIEFQSQKVKFEKISFMNIFHYLSTKRVDMAIWTEDDMKNHLNSNIKQKSLSPHTRDAAGTTDTQAALIIRTRDINVATIVNKVLIPSELMEFQQKVIEGKIIPEY
ncbi:MAG: hypothetical protein J7K66_00755 [Anaerolineaceae bacterium]|nr:hypothetical protein [Anaerolineaceae bacterium]